MSPEKPLHPNSSYSSVSTKDHDDDSHDLEANEKCCGCNWTWFWNEMAGGDLNDDQKERLKVRLGNNNCTETFNIHAESVRLIAYFFFWSLIMVATIFAKLFVPEHKINNSDLIRIFGYNNVCVLWDYSPAREYVAMFYPIFEYSFFLYVVFDYIHLRLVCKNSQTPAWRKLLKYGNVLFPIKLILIAWFRMIFVYAVDQEDVKYGVRGVVGHTLAFFGLQFGLLLVAGENIAFINATGIENPVFGTSTKLLSRVYIAAFFLNTSVQIWFAAGVFWKLWATLQVGGDNPNPYHVWIIILVDRTWMILVGLMPIWFAHVGRKTQAHVKVTFEIDNIKRD